MEQLRYGYGDFNSSTTSQRPAFIYWKLQDQQCSTIGDKHRWVVDGYQFSMVVRWLWNDRSQLPSTTKPRSQPVWALPFRYPWVVFLGSERRSFRPTLAMYETQDSDPSVSKQNIEDLDDFFPDFWWFFKENNIRKSLRYVYTGNKPVVKKTVENCWSKCSGTVQTVPLLYTVIQNIPIKIGIPKTHQGLTGWISLIQKKSRRSLAFWKRTWSDNATHLQGCKKLSSSAPVTGQISCGWDVPKFEGNFKATKTSSIGSFFGSSMKNLKIFSDIFWMNPWLNASSGK